MKELRDKFNEINKAENEGILTTSQAEDARVIEALKYARDVCLWKVSESTNGLDVALELREQIKELEG